jgi:hypothetical protein
MGQAPQRRGSILGHFGHLCRIEQTLRCAPGRSSETRCIRTSQSHANLAPLGADEVQESVKSSSCEKLAVCKVIEGAVKLSPGCDERVAVLEVVR